MTDAYIAPEAALAALRDHHHKLERLTVAIDLADRLGFRLRTLRANRDPAAGLPLITIEALIVELESLAEHYGF